MGFVKIKNVYSTKENIKKVKSPQNGRKYPEVRYLEFVSRIYNELLWLNGKKKKKGNLMKIEPMPNEWTFF